MISSFHHKVGFRGFEASFQLSTNRFAAPVYPYQNLVRGSPHQIPNFGEDLEILTQNSELSQKSFKELGLLIWEHQNGRAIEW